MVDESIPLDAASDGGEPLIAPKRNPQDAEMDITPMIDMTFLLLIFFVVCSKMDAASGPPLPPAKHGVAMPSKNAVIITVGADAEGNGIIYKGKSMSPAAAITATDPLEQESELTTYVETFINESPSDAPGHHLVLIKAAKGLKHKEISKVTRAIAKVAEVNQLYIAVEETE